jgi:hypothetical protein
MAIMVIMTIIVFTVAMSIIAIVPIIAIMDIILTAAVMARSADSESLPNTLKMKAIF